MKFGYPHGNVLYRKLGHLRPMISHGKGIYLFDADGNRYIDGSGGPFVVNVGHGRAEIIDAINQQLNDVAYVHGTMFTSDAVEKYAQALATVVPLPDPKFYLLSSGSEVVEAAIKLARQIQLARGENQRHLIIGRHQSYHGLTLGALSVSGRPSFRKPYMTMFRDMPHIPPPYLYRFPRSGEELAIDLEQAILENGPENVAAFIAEPISGASLGGAVPPSDYWPIVRQICDRYGILLISDEVIVGFGRTGTWWGLDHWDTIPDIMVSAKGAAGGYYPLGILAAQGKDIKLLQDKLGDFKHGGTFSHHAVGAAAGLATLNIIISENLIDNAARNGTLLGSKIEVALGDHPNVGDIRGRGMFWGIEFVQNKQSKEPFPASEGIALQIWQRSFDLGLILYYSQGCADGSNGDLIMVGPPLNSSEKEIDEIIPILKTSIIQQFDKKPIN